jgi:hypothetical protein
MEVAKFVRYLEVGVKIEFPCKGKGFSLIPLHPCRGSGLNRSFTSLSAIVTEATISINVSVVDVKSVEKDSSVQNGVFDS